MIPDRNPGDPHSHRGLTLALGISKRTVPARIVRIHPAHPRICGIISWSILAGTRQEILGC